jgi:hypothetical protein
MGRFKTEACRALKKIQRAAMPYEEPERVPNGWRNNAKNRRLFKAARLLREAKAAAKKKAG